MFVICSIIRHSLSTADVQVIDVPCNYLLQIQRTPDGHIVPDPVGFPSGMKALAQVERHNPLSGTYTCLASLIPEHAAV